jgi:hypothetical protein
LNWRSSKQYYKALTRAQKLLESPPEYLLTGYNCTAFAKDITQSAGQNFPKGAAMRVPADEITALVGVGWKDAYNPNSLHKSIADSGAGYVPDAAKATQQREQQRAQDAALRQAREQSRGNAISYFQDRVGQPVTMQNDFTFKDIMTDDEYTFTKNSVVDIISVDNYTLTVAESGEWQNYYVDPVAFYKAIGQG